MEGTAGGEKDFLACQVSVSHSRGTFKDHFRKGMSSDAEPLCPGTAGFFLLALPEVEMTIISLQPSWAQNYKSSVGTPSFWTHFYFKHGLQYNNVHAERQAQLTSRHPLCIQAAEA